MVQAIVFLPLLGAEFLAMILVVVYVGAVAVLFLFVIMMLDVDFAALREGFLEYLPVGLLVGAIFLAELLLVAGGWVINPTSAPIGAYCSAPLFSSAKSTSSIITTNRNNTATAPT